MIAAAFLLAATLSGDPISGTWEGTSLCQVKPSPCTDEHVIYRVRSTASRRYRLDAYKVVAGQEEFMGSQDVTFDVATSQLDGPIVSGGRPVARLRMILKGSHLSGRMILSNGTLYRLIEVDKR